jgi:hypothetical protein
MKLCHFQEYGWNCRSSMLSKISQVQKPKYHTFLLICGTCTWNYIDDRNNDGILMWKEDGGRINGRGRGRKERVLRDKRIKISAYIYVKTVQWNPPNTVWKGEEWEYNSGCGLAQSTLCTCMELSQWNPFILLIYANSKKFKFKKGLCCYCPYFSILPHCCKQNGQVEVTLSRSEGPA